ncbi:hypothetical protein [Bacillus marinisedimentorum]|uniref:hypothetical protein n=1 Tax=Bacillus marinisedimentorum TaxID=1821260 RepID=UPI000872E526|nr:hypothetical protein [Bacillus marinisedimentorum]
MDYIVSQSYLQRRREIKWNQQQTVETHHQLELYQDRIETAAGQFYIHDVFDVSCRFITEGFGFLYLHTNRGVFPYQVESYPGEFIDAYKRLK